MSERATGLLFLVVAIVGMFLVSERPSWLVTSLMLRLAFFFFLIAVVYLGFSYLIAFWPRGLQGYVLFCSLFVLGFGILIPMMPELRHKQDMAAADWAVKATALRKFKETRPKDYVVVCKPNDWEVIATCHFFNDTDGTTKGCFKDFREQPDEVCVPKK